MTAKTVLVIDDDAKTLVFMKRCLEVLEMKPLLASNSQEGLDVARREKPDAIFVDAEMPGANGKELGGALKSDPDTRAIPLMFLTSPAETGGGNGKPRNGRRCLSKRLSPVEFVDRLQTLLS